MAGNKIGIEVQVEFPTVTELQKQLAEKWVKVKSGFEGKINIGVDGHSLNKVKKTIQDALDTKEFQIKLDSKLALNEIGLVQKDLKKLDEQISKVREIKIKFEVADMNKSMKEIIANNQKIEDGIDKSNAKTKEQTTSLQQQLGAYDKIVRKFKLIDGKKVNTHVKTTYTDEKGKSTVRSENLKTGDVTEDQTNNALKIRQDRLKEIEDVMKRIHRVELDSMKAGKDELKVLNDEKKVQTQQLELLKTMYYQKYKTNAIIGTSLQEVKRLQDVAKAVKEAQQWQQALNEEQREMASAVQKVVALEQKKHALQLKMISALESEKASLQEQFAHYNKIQGKIQDKYNLESKMTDEQREQMSNLKAINSLEESRVAEKKKQQALDAKTAQDQREANQKLTSDLKEIHALKTRIAQIESRRDQGGVFGAKEQAELRILQQQLGVKKGLISENRELLNSQGLVTQETYKQLKLLSQINQAELSRVADAQKVVAQNDKITAEAKKQKEAFEQVLQVEQNIVKLQRDLIFAGMREKDIIEKAVAEERLKAQQMTEQLRLSGALTADRQREIKAIREATTAQSQLNAKRQQAREKDQSYNDTGGLIDPYSTYANGRQAFEAILAPMKEIDEAFYKVAKVADASDEAMKNFKESAFDVGTSLGTSASAYMSAVETWVTAGKTFQESQELGQISQIGSFVGNIEPDDMVRYMAVPLNAFEEQGIKATDVINVMNETANNHAVEMEHLGKAYLRSAATMTDAGVSFEQLTGLITGAQEATRIGGERIGTALKTVGMNYNLIKTQVTKDQQKKFNFFDSIGVNLDDTDGLYDALEKLQGKWKDLSAEQRNNSIYYLAGKEHGNIVNAIVKEWDTVEKTIKEAKEQMNMGKDGSAYIEFAKQSDSLRFKLAELKNMWDKLMVTMGDSDGAMSGALDALIDGLNILGKLASNPAIMTMLKAIAGVMIVHAGANGVKRLWDTLSTGLKSQVKAVADIGLAWKGVKTDVDRATASVGRFDLAERGAGSNGAPNVNSAYRDRDGNDLRDRNGNVIVNPNLDRPSDHRDRNGNELLDRNGNRIHDIDSNNRNAGSGGNASADGAERSVGKLGKTLGKVLSIVPLLGDAMILLEIAGVPVFDSIGKAIDKVFKGTEDTLKETEKLVEKFKGQNELINGTIDAHRSKIATLEGDAVEAGVIKKDEKTGDLTTGKADYMEDEEAFKKFKADFNAQAEGMGVDVRITMNDTTHILEALKALNVQKEKLTKEAQVKVVSQISKDTSGREKTEGSIAKTKLEHDQAVAQVKRAEEALKSLRDANGKIVDPVAYANWQVQLERANEKIKKTDEDLKTQTKTYNTQKKAIEDNARALLAEGENFDASTMSKKESKDVTIAMVSEYKKLKTNSNELTDIQGKLNKGKKLENAEFEKLIKKFPEYENVGKSKLETDQALREEVSKKLEKDRESRDSTLKTAEIALTKSAEQVDALDKEAGMLDTVKGAIDATTGATDKSNEATKNFNKTVDEIKPEKSFTLKIKAIGKDILDSVKSFWNTTFGTKEVTVGINEKKSGGGKKGDSVQVGTTRTARTGMSSASVSTGTKVRGAGSVVSEAKAYTSKYDNNNSTQPNNSRVSEDVWRYWGTEMKQSSLESAMRDLERAVTEAKDDYAKVISSLTKEISNLKAQQANQVTLRSQKDSEMNSVLGKLKAYGFNVNTSSNTISNLGQAKNLKGEKAEEAEALLQTFNSLTGELSSINDKIKDLGAEITATQDKIKDAKIAKELKAFEVSLKRITALTTSITNSDNIFGTKFAQMGALDKELNLKTNEEALAKSKTNLSSLVKEFNTLSLATIGYKENGEQLQGTLDSLGSQILAQADNIIKYRQAINDIEFSRINEDMQEFNNTLTQQTGKLKNNIENLQEGLLSGTSFGSLQSSKGGLIDLSRDNVYEKEAQERINLEKEVQDALIAFAKKNVDRASGVANATLDVNAKMYNQLLTMQKNYTKGSTVSAKTLTAQYGNLDDIALIDKDYADTVKALEGYYENVKKKQDELTKKYNDNMAKAKDPKEKEALTNQFILDNLDIEKQYYEAQIKGNNKAIQELNNQLKDASEADKEKILSQIATYEQSNIDSQNSIKDSIKARFDLEFSLMNASIQKSNDAKNSLQNTYELLSSLGAGNFSGKGTILDSLLDVENVRNAQIKKNIADLQKQQGLYEVGSYEWKIINDQLGQFNSQLNDSNKQLIDMNKNVLSNSFSSATHDLERLLFGGKSHDAWQQHQQLWISGLEKEIALEKMYKRMADLGTIANKEKLDLLAKQETLSKFEMEYLNKQLDIIELQQKVDNLSKQRTVQVLKQNEFGQWDWTYEADATQLDKAKDELSQAELALQKLEEKAREDYLQQLNKILADAQSGQFESVEDFQKAMEDLGKAFGSIVGDIPEIGDTYIKDLVEAYAKFVTDNAGVVAGGNPADSYLVQATETMTDSLKKTFTDMSSSLGEIFANALLAKLPNTSVSANKSILSGSTAISIDKLEFPNATNKDEIQSAILGLPQLALQKANSKI